MEVKIFNMSEDVLVDDSVSDVDDDICMESVRKSLN